MAVSRQGPAANFGIKAAPAGRGHGAVLDANSHVRAGGSTNRDVNPPHQLIQCDLRAFLMVRKSRHAKRFCSG